MRKLVSLSAAAWLLWAAPAAFGQYTGAYGGPALLPLPETTVPAVQNQGIYQQAYSSQPTYSAQPVYRAAPGSMMAPRSQAYAAPVSAQYAPRRGPVFGRASYAQQPPQDGPASPPPSPTQEIVPPAPDAPEGAGMSGPQRGQEPVWGEQSQKSGCSSEPSSCNGGGCYANTYSNSAFADSVCGEGSCAPTWYASLAAISFTRDRGNKYWTTYETNNNPNQLMNTQDAKADWGFGGEIMVGHKFGCCLDKAIEVSYFTFTDLEGSASMFSPTDELSTPIDLGFSQIGADLTSDFFDNAREHAIWRENTFHNVEVNFVKYPLGGGCCDRFSAQWLTGFRYMYFNEDLLFGAAQQGTEFGDNGGTTSAYLDTNVTNHLIGWQVGARGFFNVCDNFSLFATPKVGIYANQIENHDSLYRGDGLNGFDISSSKTDVAVVGELSVGATWQLSQRFSLFGGYRVIAMSGVALSDNQIPHYMVAYDEWADVDSNGSLLLHGGFLGGQYCF